MSETSQVSFRSAVSPVVSWSVGFSDGICQAAAEGWSCRANPPAFDKLVLLG